MKIPSIDLPQKVINELTSGEQAKRIIIFKGGQGSGKTTEACLLAKHLGKPIELVTMKQDENDYVLYDELGVERHDITNKQVKPIIDRLRSEKNKTLICDDWETIVESSRDKRESIEKKQFINELRSNDIHLFMIWHNQKIPKNLLERPRTLLVLKESIVSETEIQQYVTEKRIAKKIVEFVRKLRGYDTLYLFKDGGYYCRKDGEYEKGIFKPYTPLGDISENDIHCITIDLIENGYSHKDIREEYGISEHKLGLIINQHIKPNEELSKRYEAAKKQSFIDKVIMGYREEKGLHIHYLTNQLRIDTEQSDKFDIDDALEKALSIGDMKDLQDLGDTATWLIGDVIVGYLKFKIYALKEPMHLIINETTSGADVILRYEGGEKQIEIEVKNIQSSKKHPTYYPSELKDIANKFSDKATEIWLFAFGKGISDKYLSNLGKEYDMNFIHVSDEQIYENSEENKMMVFKKIYPFLKKILE